MEKKSASVSSVSNDNSSGTVSVTMGILSLIFAFVSPPIGIIFGIIGFFFGSNQSKKQFKGWGKLGIVLSLVGAILGIALWILTIVILAPYMDQIIQQVPQ